MLQFHIAHVILFSFHLYFFSFLWILKISFGFAFFFIKIVQTHQFCPFLCIYSLFYPFFCLFSFASSFSMTIKKRSSTEEICVMELLRDGVNTYKIAATSMAQKCSKQTKINLDTSKIFSLSIRIHTDHTTLFQNVMHDEWIDDLAKYARYGTWWNWIETMNGTSIKWAMSRKNAKCQQQEKTMSTEAFNWYNIVLIGHTVFLRNVW